MIAALDARAAPMTKLERERLVAHLEMTERWLGLELRGLSEAREPKGQVGTAADGLAKFGKLRAAMLEYARTTRDDLRTHTVQKSKTDLYQWLLMISTHSQRHLLQIQEIKASAGYPVK